MRSGCGLEAVSKRSSKPRHDRGAHPAHPARATKNALVAPFDPSPERAKNAADSPHACAIDRRRRRRFARHRPRATSNHRQANPHSAIACKQAALSEGAQSRPAQRSAAVPPSSARPSNAADRRRKSSRAPSVPCRASRCAPRRSSATTISSTRCASFAA